MLVNKLFGAAIGAAMLASFATMAHAADPLRIGVPTDLSGTYATLGDEVMRAVAEWLHSPAPGRFATGMGDGG